MTSISAVVIGLISAVLVVAAAEVAAAQGLGASVTFDGQPPTTLAPPVALLDPATARVSMLFAVSPPPPALQAAGRLSGRWDLTKAGPALLVEFDFTPGASTGLAEQLRSCHITSAGLKGRVSISGTAQDCHVRTLGGALTPGGLLIGLIDGNGAGYTLHLPFTAAFTDANRTTRPALGGAAAAAITGVPSGTVSGSASYIGQTLVFSNGLAWWDAPSRTVHVMFFDHTPRPGILAEARTGTFGDGPPTMQLALRFDANAAPDVAAVETCAMTLTFPKGGPIATASAAEGCGIAKISAFPLAGGTVSAVLEGQARGPVADYAWDVRFNLPIAK